MQITADTREVCRWRASNGACGLYATDGTVWLREAVGEYRFAGLAKSPDEAFAVIRGQHKAKRWVVFGRFRRKADAGKPKSQRKKVYQHVQSWLESVDPGDGVRVLPDAERRFGGAKRPASDEHALARVAAYERRQRILGWGSGRWRWWRRRG